jgi:radical SAM-linked protein
MDYESRDTYYREILPRVKKPSRYIGCECNLSSEGYGEGSFNVLLMFPDTYEIGMSHQGLRILYGELAGMEGVGVEFAFAPWPDMEKRLRQRGQPLRSLQTGTPANRFDLLGISMTYELHYTNMLMMLELAGLSLSASQRKEDDPLVIAGGPCCMNPLPFLKAVDAIFLGEAEESLPEAVESLISLPRPCKRLKRREALAGVDGVYVSGITETATIQRYQLEGNGPVNIPILPSASMVHDRLSVEVQRGCTRGCRFCQAGIMYRPRREKSVDRIVEEVCRGLDSTGWDEISLFSLSTSDYSRLDELLDRLTPRLERRRVSLAMPSLRPETITGNLVHALSLVRKSGFTLAPEAGTSRLRDFINKGINDDEIVEGCERVIERGWQRLKLYFMVGLPTEQREDLEGIVRLVERILALRRKSGRFKLTVSLSPFAPKPHTPFQWERQCSIREIEEKQRFLYRSLSGSRVDVRPRNSAMSVLEGMMARADEGMWPVLRKAYRMGCRFDGWDHQFRFDIWKAALEEYGYTPYRAEMRFNPDDKLPWEVFNSGVTREFLLDEREKAYQLLLTPDCSVHECNGCGVCFGEENFQVGKKSTNAGEKVSTSVIADSRANAGEKVSASVTADSRANRNADSEIAEHEVKGNHTGGYPGIPQKETLGPTPEKGKKDSSFSLFFRYRCVYERKGVARFLSHREILNIIQRVLRRSCLPINYTSGFRPRPRISAGPSLSVGSEGINEFFDMELTREAMVTPGLLNPFMPEGLEVKECRGPFSRKEGKVTQEAIFIYRLYFDGILSSLENKSLHDPVDFTYREIKEIIARGDRIKDIKGRSRSTEGCSVEYEGNTRTVRLTLPSGKKGGLKPRDFLEVVIPKERDSIRVRRLAILYKIEDSYIDPMELVERGKGR